MASPAPTAASRFTRLRATLARAIAPSTVRNEVVRTSRDLLEVLRERWELETESGAIVTSDTAMRVSWVFACVRVLSEDIAALPLKVYRRQATGRDLVTDHWLPALLEAPNAWQTGFEFRELIGQHVELSGNFYALKTVVRDEVRELLPLAPQRVTPTLDRWRMTYRVTMPDGASLDVPADRMVHIKGPSLDGVVGVSPIAYHRELVGLALSQLRYGARLFRNGAMVGGVLEHPGELSDDAARRLRESFDEQYAGVGNAHKTLLLEEGLKFSKTGMSANEAQWLDSRKFGRTEIASIYRVPPHLIADLDRATFSNMEEQGTNYVVYGLVPRLRRIEARLVRSLVPERERGTLYVEHLVDGLMRGNYAVRMAGYQTAVQTGWMSRNEVRARENLNPGPPELDVYLDPAFLTGSGPKPAAGAAADAALSARR